MKRTTGVLVAGGLLGIGLVLLLLLRTSGPEKPAASRPSTRPSLPGLRLALPAQANATEAQVAYRTLSDYLRPRLGQTLDLVALDTRQAAFDALTTRQIDAAILDTLAVAVAMDRHGAIPLVHLENRRPTACGGAIVVRDDSPVRAPADLADKSIALISGTFAGALVPLVILREHGGLPPQRDDPRLLWLPDDDQVIQALGGGRVETGAINEFCPADHLRHPPATRLRPVLTCPPVPGPTLVLRAELAARLGPRLAGILRDMHNDPEARPALMALNIARFVDCPPSSFDPVFEWAARAGPAWELVGIPGPAPARPSTTRPAP